MGDLTRGVWSIMQGSHTSFICFRGILLWKDVHILLRTRIITGYAPVSSLYASKSKTVRR